MNILDENIPGGQWRLLQSQGVRARKIGTDIGRAGMQDEEVIALLHSLRHVTFLTRDRDFADPRLHHARYCLIRLDCRQAEVAELIRRVLRHPELNTHAKRMGAVIRASHAGLRIWRRAGVERTLAWPVR